MKNTAEHSDLQRLITGCKNGKACAQKQVYELYASAMFAVCMRYVSDREIARDILQDGFIKVYTKLDDYTAIGAFEGWMRRIFINTALEYLRQNANNKMHVAIDDLDLQIADDNVSVLQKISADDLMSCVCSLPIGYRTVFNLYALEGYSHAEIADMLEISENTSRSQFMRARKLLQQKVIDIC